MLIECVYFNAIDPYLYLSFTTVKFCSSVMKRSNFFVVNVEKN